MISFIPVFIHSNNSKEKIQHPKCPHCKKTLKDWTKPSDDVNLLIISIASFIILFFVSNIIAGSVGASDASFNVCDKMFSKRYHYILPAYPTGCVISRWLQNKEVYPN
jgi:hypothetical protein